MRSLGVTALIACGCRLGFSTDGAISDGAASPDATILEQQALAWYRMEALVEVAGVRKVVDETGNGHHAQCDAVLCPVLVPGRDGMVARFAGASELRVTGTSALRTESGFTVTSWVKIETAPAGDCFLQKLYGTSERNSWQLCLLSDSRVLYFSSTLSEGHQRLESPSPIAHGTWHHLALLWNGTLKQLVIGGTLVAATEAPIEFDDRDVVIGRDYNRGVPDLPFHGELDDILIFDRALTLAELGELAAR